MAFWGVEVKPGNRYTHLSNQTRGRLRITQAVLGNMVGGEKSLKTSSRNLLQCNIGNMKPILICSFFSDQNENCHLELEFEEQQEVVFSVLGQRSVHLSGYFIGNKGFNNNDSEDTNGEDINNTESEGSHFEDDSYESDFINDDDIIDDVTSEEEKGLKGEKKNANKRKKYQVIESDSDEEFEFNNLKKDVKKSKDNKSNLQEKEGVKSKKFDNKGKNVNLVDKDEDNTAKTISDNEEKKKKKKDKKEKKKLKQEKEKIEKKETKKIETFANGLIIEEIITGDPNAQIAKPNSKVYVNYVGKLQNGTEFDSNVGQKPFKFRLGKGQVIKGWDIGINGMRVGEKRRLTIPPTLGYGDKEVNKIPKNSWLDFDVELVKVK